MGNQSPGQRGNHKKIRKCSGQLNDNKDASYQNLWGAAKAAFRRKFVILNTYLFMKEV